MWQVKNMILIKNMGNDSNKIVIKNKIQAGHDTRMVLYLVQILQIEPQNILFNLNISEYNRITWIQENLRMFVNGYPKMWWIPYKEGTK